MKGDKHLLEIKEVKNQKYCNYDVKASWVFMTKRKGNNYINEMKDTNILLVLVSYGKNFHRWK